MLLLVGSKSKFRWKTAAPKFHKISHHCHPLHHLRPACIWLLFVVPLFGRLRAIEPPSDGRQHDSSPTIRESAESRNAINDQAVRHQWEPQLGDLFANLPNCSAPGGADTSRGAPSLAPDASANTDDDLVGAPATSSQAPSQAPGLDEHRAQVASLAELTAAGTAAGLLFHDLMTQANMQADERSLDPADLQEDMGGQQTDAHIDQQPHFDQGPQPDISVAQRAPVYGASSERQPTAASASFVDEQGHLLAGQSSAQEAAQEPPGDEQMPDSMESLLRSEGEDSAADDEADEQANRRAGGSSLVNADELGGARQPVGAPPNGVQGADSNRDEDEADEAGWRPQEGQHDIRVSASGQPYSASQPLGLAARSAEDLEQRLVAPMRDSLEDLSVAAGHYYGKKKKKKVKKVKKKVIIKKKKKKKYKKVKVVKKYKKKKVKKPKKMAHHDHGKYYM